MVGKKLIAIVLITGLLLCPSTTAWAMDSKVLNEIKTLIHYFYYEDIQLVDMKDKSYSQVLELIHDPYARYIAPNESNQVLEIIKAELGVVGVTVGQVNGHMAIINIIPGTQAATKQLEPGELILAIGGKETTSLTAEQAQELLAGPVGTEVELLVEKGGSKRSVKLVRENLAGRTVWSELLDEKWGYIKVKSFGQNTPFEFQRALSHLETRQAQGIILDLRNNSGGVIDSVLGVANLIIPEGPVTHIVNRQRTPRFRYTTGNGQNKPLVVLVNGSSASAAEILASAVQDNQVGTVVGTRTTGKSAIQSMYRLSDGGSFIFTTAQYLTPKGNVIHGQGVAPDHVVSDPKEQLARAKAILERHFAEEEELNPNKVMTWVFIDVGSDKYFVNGWEMSFRYPPFVLNNATYVPLRTVSENMGGFIEYFADTGEIRIKFSSTTMSYYISSRNCIINGEEKLMNYPVIMRDGRAFVHLRFFAEQLGAEVNWNQEFRRISIYM